MNITIERSDINSIKKFAKKAIEENLYIEGFDLKKALQKLIKLKKERLNSSFIFLLKNENDYIGICTFLMTEYIPIQTFIKKEFRNKGYGKLLIKEVIGNVSKNFKKRISFGLGEIDSLFFFYGMIKNKIISIEEIKDDGQKTLIDILEKYIYCLEYKVDIKKVIPKLNDLFLKEDIEKINKYATSRINNK